MNRTWCTAFAVTTSLLVAHGTTLACSLVEYTGVVRGLLGRSTYLAEESPSSVPRNVAVVNEVMWRPGDEVVPLEAVTGTPFSRPAELLIAGEVVTVGGVSVTVEDVVDELPPTPPELREATVERSGGGCGRSAGGCDGHTLRLTITPTTDDHTPVQFLTYALFAGETEDEASSATAPLRLLVVREDEARLSDGWDTFEVESVQWVSLAAIDQAGNSSERTPARRLRR